MPAHYHQHEFNHKRAMAISIPSSYGLIAKRGSRTEEILLADWKPSIEQVEAHSDERLFGLAIAQSAQEAGWVVDMLKTHDLHPGRDFAVTSSAQGIFANSAPPWLVKVGDRSFELRD